MNDHEGIRETVQRYFDGLYHSRGADLRAAFHENARITGIVSDSGERSEMNLDQFVKFAENQPSAAAAGEAYEMSIENLDVKGAVASVKVVDVYIGKRFTDLLLLLKEDGSWRIYSKLWHADPL